MTPLNPDLDLELTRLMQATPAQIWRCWTDPELLPLWWAPKPVTTRHAVIDLRPGGRFHTLMILPDGTEYPTEGCLLEVLPERRLTMTEVLEAGFRPAANPMLRFTAVITLTPEGKATRYTARAMHSSPDTRQQHVEMGFHDGWGTAATQLEALASTL
ncbi:MAG TPA: SRPBCC family protein [Paracoccaceae bacterium]